MDQNCDTFLVVPTELVLNGNFGYDYIRMTY